MGESSVTTATDGAALLEDRNEPGIRGPAHRSVQSRVAVGRPIGLEGEPHEQGELVALGVGFDGLGHDGEDAGGGEDHRVVMVIENFSLDVGEGEAGSGQDGGEIVLGHAPSSTAGGRMLLTFCSGKDEVLNRTGIWGPTRGPLSSKVANELDEVLGDRSGIRELVVRNLHDIVLAVLVGAARVETERLVAVER